MATNLPPTKIKKAEGGYTSGGSLTPSELRAGAVEGTLQGGAKPLPKPPVSQATAGEKQLPKPPQKEGGGGLPKPPKKGEEDEGQDVENLIQQNFTDILTGKLKRYSPELMAQMKQGIFKSTIGAKRGRELEAMRQAAVTGSFRSASMQRRLQEIDTSSRQQYAEGIQTMMMDAAKAEWEDRQKALDQAQNWLNAKRQYILGKKQIAATLEAARIQAGATVAAARLGADATKAAARAGAGAQRAAIAENARQFDQEMAFKREQANINQQRQQALDTAGLLGF